MKVWATWTRNNTTSQIGIEYNEEVSNETAINDLEHIASKLFQGHYDYAWYYEDKKETP